MKRAKLKRRPGRAAVALGVVLIAMACGESGPGLDTLAGPSRSRQEPPLSPEVPSVPNPTPPPEPVPIVRRIQIGDIVADTLVGHGNKLLYEVVAPATGTLTLHLEWKWRDGLLSMKVGEEHFTAFPPDWAPPIAGRLPVDAGQSYRVTVLDAAPWDYDDLRLPFLLTATLQ